LDLLYTNNNFFLRDYTNNNVVMFKTPIVYF